MVTKRSALARATHLRTTLINNALGPKTSVMLGSSTSYACGTTGHEQASRARRSDCKRACDVFALAPALYARHEGVRAPRAPAAEHAAAAASAACTLTDDGPVRKKDDTSANPRG